MVANEQRLRLLWLLFKGQSASVGELAALVGLSQPNTSIQLRAIQSRGLISSRKQGLFVYYYAQANEAVEHAPLLLGSLSECHAKGVGFSQIVRDATGFTHWRRIDIVKTLPDMPASSTVSELSVAAGIPVASLGRHLRKLEARHYIEAVGGDSYALGQPESMLAKVLLGIARREKGST